MPRRLALAAALVMLAALGRLPVAAQPRVPERPPVIALQCNIDRTGRFSGRDSGPVTWGTARGFAQEVSRLIPEASPIGMQEVDSDEGAQELRRLLNQETGKDWTYLWTSQGIRDHGDGLAILWRRDLVSLERDLGKTPIDYLDDGTILRFMGGWFRQLATGRTFGFFTGRLAPPRQFRGALEVSERIQRWEAWRAMEWIGRVMEPHPDDARIIAVDLGAAYGSEPWFQFRQGYEEDGDKRFTVWSHQALFKGKRHDYLWWDGHGGPRRYGGIIGHTGRSEHFGGDHRFVWAMMRL